MPEHHRIGSRAWSDATGGRLSAAEKRRLAPAVVAAHATMAVGRAGRALHLDRGRHRTIDLDQLRVPGTILTRVAEAHAIERLGPAILNHSYRTYAFGLALGLVHDVPVDRELLYTAALLHDATLPHGSDGGRDFTVDAARMAEQVAADVGLPRGAAETVMSAITMHHRPGVRRSDGAVAFLLSAGAALDVIGLRSWQLAPATIDAVVGRHPRLGFKREFTDAFRRESTRVPDGRVRYLRRYAAFDAAIRFAPFRE